MKPKRIEVDELMQQDYAYFLTEPIGRNFHPDFRPELTPKQMLELGVFGGRYMTDCTDEYPTDWFENARLCPERHDPQLNYFGVTASQPLSVWRMKGWIYHEDPRGDGTDGFPRESPKTRTGRVSRFRQEHLVGSQQFPRGLTWAPPTARESESAHASPSSGRGILVLRNLVSELWIGES